MEVRRGLNKRTMFGSRTGEEIFWGTTESYKIGSPKKYRIKRKTANSEFGVVDDIYGYQKNLKNFDLKKTPGLSPPANYTDRLTAACR
jgi:hypothetical protein